MVFSRIIDGGFNGIDPESLIKKSGLFDAQWYASQRGLKGGAAKALSHFIKTKGAHDPSPQFSCSAYLSDNVDVRDAGLNPLLHYLRFGKDEGRVIRDIHGRVSGLREELGEEAIAYLRHLFDDRFYFAANPDLSKEIDLFEHFMSVGWRQRRDPTHWFSVEAYLTDHGDLCGRNPFIHYVLTGSREGKTIRKSRQTNEGHTEREPNKKLTVAAVAMVKNEADIIKLFASHLLALFDDIVIVDHQSEDGTGEFLKALAKSFPRVQVLNLREPSYIQSVTMTHVMREHPSVRCADWVFFLDADEFLPFQSREEFHVALTEHQRCPIITIPWINVIPAHYWTGVVTLCDETEFFMPPSHSPFHKIAFQPNRLNVDRVVVAQGNHTLITTLNGLEMRSFAANFHLFHVPVRSVDQILLKLNQGVQSYQKLGKTRDRAQGTHWHRMKQATVEQSIDDDFLNAMAVNYSEDDQSLQPITRQALADLGFSSCQLRFVTQETGLDMPERRTLGEMLMRIYSADFSEAAEKDEPSATQLRSCENGDLVRAKDQTSEYGKLPPLQEPDAPLMQAVSALLSASRRDIDDLVSSDWTGHVPFAFALTSLMKPRRYVELGTLGGTSFIAFAQAAKDMKIETELVAVSSWASEDSCDEAAQKTFETFEFVASKYRDNAAILRMDYTQAAHRFADGSIDLLNLDGFFDAEGLEEVLDTWRPKLSSRGAIMMHDINAQHAGSSVWRVWENMRSQFPTLEFRHDQGLGVACCGPQVSPALLTLAKRASHDRALHIMLQDHFAQQGRASAELFSRRYDMAQMDLRLGSGAALSEELVWTQQELSAARAELDQLRDLVGAEYSQAAGA